MTRFRLTIEYDGRPFVGWQRQTRGDSVQGLIEAALRQITGEMVAVHAAGRTDAGVHAAAMVAHVDIAKPVEAYRLLAGLNGVLRPAPIAILACVEATPTFHARFDCMSRRYEYRIVNRRPPLTVAKGLAWQVSLPLDAAAMDEAAKILVGRHDFTTFRSIKCQATSPVRTLDELTVSRDGELILIAAEARSFLHHQVRSMVGCLKLVGEGAWTAAMLGEALAARDRTQLGFNAPPDGLTFVSARY